MPILKTFSTPVWHTTISDHEKVDAELLAYIADCKSSGDKGRNRTNVGGWQSNNLDFSRLPLFRQIVVDLTDQIAKELDIREDQETVIDSCWINVNYKDSYNRAHTHPNCMISGVYYVQVPENSGDLVFTDPRPQTGCLLFPANKNNALTSMTVRTKPQSGLLVAFPSWLSHYVDYSQADGERISVAFNYNYLPAG